MNRVGKIFENGAPYLGRSGVCYEWHGPSVDFEDLFNADRSDLADFLLSALREDLMNFGCSTKFGSNPYLQQGVKGFALHIGDGGRWVDVQPFLGGGVTAFHNLNALADKLAGFNVGANVLEYFDKDVRAPRVSLEGGNFLVEYFLPEGSELLPIDSNDWFFRGEGIERVFGVSGFEKIDGKYGEGFQRISCVGGEVVVRDGVCRASGFSGYDVCEITFLMAKMMDIFLV